MYIPESTCLHGILTMLVANLGTIHAKRVMLQQKDMILVHAMQKILIGYVWPGNISSH